MTDHVQEMIDNSESMRAARSAATAAELAKIEASIPRQTQRVDLPPRADAIDVLSTLTPMIETQWQQDEATTLEAILDDANLLAMRASGAPLQQVWNDYARQEESIKSNRSLSDVGKRELLERARNEREAALDQIENDGVGALARQFVSAYQSTPWGETSPEVAQRTSLLLQKFPLMTAEDFELSAVETLRTAIESTDNRTKSEANMLLRDAYLDLMRRRAHAPEKHAEERKPKAEAIANAIAQHLDNLTGDHRARVARSAAQLVSGQFKSLRTITKQNGRFDITLARVTAQHLFPAAA